MRTDKKRLLKMAGYGNSMVALLTSTFVLIQHQVQS